MRSGAVELNMIMYYVLFLVGTWRVNPGWLGAHTPGWTLAGCTSRERSLAGGDLSDVANMSSVAVEIKVLFDRYNCEPGPKCRVFRRNVVQCFSETDDRGFSLADCLLRADEGAAAPGTDINGVPHVAMVGAPALPAVGQHHAPRQGAKRPMRTDSKGANQVAPPPPGCTDAVCI